MTEFWYPQKRVLLQSVDNKYVNKFNGREGFLFVVDTNLIQSRHRFFQALEIIRSALLSGILTNNKDMFGILFVNKNMPLDSFEDNYSENLFIPSNCCVYLLMRELTKAIVTHFLKFVTSLHVNLKNIYNLDNTIFPSFSNIMRLCLALLEYPEIPLINSTVIYMTDTASPHNYHTREYYKAMQKAVDLKLRNVEFQILPMIDNFDYSMFFKEFTCLVRGADLESFLPENEQQLRDRLSDRKLKQDFLKRSLGHFKFCFGSNLNCSAQYYNFFRKRSYPNKIKLRAIDNAIVLQRATVNTNNDISLNGGWYELKLGNMVLRMTSQQTNRVKNMHSPGMMLLGFKPKAIMKQSMYYEPCNFMYPDDQQTVGSKRLFFALWHRCLKHEVIAVCIFLRKINSIPRYVALMPLEHNNTSNSGVSIMGDGFKIVYLPMVNHIRNVDLTEWKSSESIGVLNQVYYFEDAIKQLRIKYQPSLINDPYLEILQANLLQLSLNIETDNEGLTKLPTVCDQNKRIATSLQSTNHIFGTDAKKSKEQMQSVDKIKRIKLHNKNA